jgi:hypothetical protein
VTADVGIKSGAIGVPPSGTIGPAGEQGFARDGQIEGAHSTRATNPSYEKTAIPSPPRIMTVGVNIRPVRLDPV